MNARPRLRLVKPSYFTSEKENISFIPTGCTLLDCALGGGWALGRIANIVGDKSTAKTGLSTEAMINFKRTFPKGLVRYCEAESAFDDQYAAAMGLPIDQIDFSYEVDTVEDFMRDFEVFLAKCVKAKEPGIYILDSLDALSDDAEMEREIGKGTYGAAKPKLMSEFFRRNRSKIKQANVFFLVVSQVRDNIGVMFGEKHKRSGGRALDFYASQVLWLAKTKTLTRKSKGVERAYGIALRGQVKKNKVGLPFREAEFEFIFGYWIEDLGASVDWLTEVKRLKDAGLDDSYLEKFGQLTDEQYLKDQTHVSKVVKQVWADIEKSFLPTRTKYGVA